VAVSGVSYGGFLSNIMATRFTDTFCSAMVLSGASNIVSKTGTTDVPEANRLLHGVGGGGAGRLQAVANGRDSVVGGQPRYPSMHALLDSSPVSNAYSTLSPLRTHTLIAHGKLDARVHPGQALEMYRALQANCNATHQLVMYPSEGHGLKKHKNRLDFAKRQLAWLESSFAAASPSA
jgi:dipeptidyl aminopeptidase/acylaminoacyl peptidase